MPRPVRKMQKANAAAHAALERMPKISPELLDQFMKGPMTADAVQSASQAFKKALIERALGAEMSEHLGYPAGADKPETATNHQPPQRQERQDTFDRRRSAAHRISRGGRLGLRGALLEHRHENKYEKRHGQAGCEV